MKYSLLLTFVIIGTLGNVQSFRPPGTVQIFENFFFNQHEITNIDWKEYQSWIKTYGPGEESEQFKSTVLDTTVWGNRKNNGLVIYDLEGNIIDSVVWRDLAYGEKYNEPYVKTYHHHPAYNNYPVVGVRYDQAVAYCKWRTMIVKENLKKTQPNLEFPNFKYRLPKKVEWELIAKTGFDRPKMIKVAQKKDISYPKMYNLRYQVSEPQFVDRKRVIMPAPAESYYPNEYGMYHLIGNVAEMVEERGIAKGGSWAHQFDDMVYSMDYIYKAPGAWIGFRCVCEIIEQ